MICEYLKDITEQQVFDKVANHLLKQMKKSEIRTRGNDSQCAYRSREGLACAAGCLISDEEYDLSFDASENMQGGITWDWLVDQKIVAPDHKYLIEMLQLLHDRNDPDNWRHCLVGLAAEFNLKPPAAPLKLKLEEELA